MLSFISEVTRVSGRRTGVGSLGLFKRTGKNRDRDVFRSRDECAVSYPKLLPDGWADTSLGHMVKTTEFYIKGQVVSILHDMCC